MDPEEDDVFPEVESDIEDFDLERAVDSEIDEVE